MEITIAEYAERINRLAKEYPNAVMVYSADDEGNSDSELYTMPHAGNLNEDGEFDSESDEVNAICIN